VKDWLIKEEPILIKKIYDFYFKTEAELSFDSTENSKRLEKVSDYLLQNAAIIYSGLNQCEKLLLYIMKSGFGWIVYENIESTLKIISKIFHFEYDELSKALESLFKKFLIFKFERLKNYSFFFSPPVFLRNIDIAMNKEDIFGEEDSPQFSKDLLNHQYIPLIAGLISYVVTYSPRSSETNEIHKIDLAKMLEFFTDFSEKEYLEQVIKKLTRFGFFQKFNNRIIINKSLFDAIINLSINEQLFIIFLYDFMDKFDFRKSAFMTLKILAVQTFNNKTGMPLRELFFHYLNNEIYISLKNEPKNLKFLLKQEELKFMYFVKSLESENIVVLKRQYPDVISIATDYIIMNEPHTSLLNNIDFSHKFVEEKFIVETNYEIIVEPYLRPDILFRLALISEPLTIQTISIFRITKESIYRSFAYGIKKEEILEFLNMCSKHPVPVIVSEGIRSFINSLTLENMNTYKIIQVSAHFYSLIKDHFKNQIIEVEPHTFLVFESELLKRIEEYTKSQRIAIRYINDFLNEKYSASLIQNMFTHNIKHLHTMKDFFDYYGNEPMGVNLKIDNGI
jgi:hypothetical protein